MSEVKPPLSGLRVWSLPTRRRGPSRGLFLADMGAQVFRVEPPVGDPTRRLKGFGRATSRFSTATSAAWRLI